MSAVVTPSDMKKNVLSSATSAVGSKEKSREATPKTAEATPRSREMTPKSREATPKTAEATPRSREMTPKSREAAASKVIVLPHTQKKSLYILVLLTLILGIFIGALIVFLSYKLTAESEPIILPAVKKPDEPKNDNNKTNACTKVNKCSLKGYSKPPLIILSLDGFRRDYLDTGIFQSLEQMKNCGATAEHVYPSFPSATFPNHYSISTGKYATHHGIVHNRFIDNSILPDLYEREHHTETLYVKADPLFVQYEKEGGKSACFLWPGCNKNISGVPTSLMGRIKFEMNVTLEEKLNKTIDWLLMDSADRPGLVMLYHPEPDTLGHQEGGDVEKTKPILFELEREISAFLAKIKENGLFDCVNFLVVSDHGMQKVTKHYDLSKMLNLEGLEVVSGIVGKIYNKNSTLTNVEILETLRNLAGTDYRVYLREELPPRWHYAESSSVGDIIFVEKPGVAVLGNTEHFHKMELANVSGQHGYDYLHDNLRTVFFAQGPSIKPGTVLPPFQNVEYLNLFRDLLDLPVYANDGTAGVMDEILVNPPLRIYGAKQLVSECGKNGGASLLNFCSNCSVVDQTRMIASLNKCSAASSAISPFISSNNSLCYQQYCQKTVIVNTNGGQNVILWERLSKFTQRNTSTTCTVTDGKYNMSSGCRAGTELAKLVSLSAAKDSEFSQIQEGMISLPEGFVKDVLTPLNRLTRFYTDGADSLLVVTGVTYDYDLDGLKDSNTNNTLLAPTHFYRILLRCGSEWQPDGSCRDEEKLDVLSFIFPIFPKDRNDLKSEDLLLDYTARLKDVELIAGFELEIPKISLKKKNLLKTRIVTQLW